MNDIVLRKNASYIANSLDISTKPIPLYSTFSSSTIIGGVSLCGQKKNNFSNYSDREVKSVSLDGGEIDEDNGVGLEGIF